jgi:NAD(P)-dependent dehydrogenase (short-subunit alcohol dehydrogenase family)
MEFKDKTALITGSATGIGRALAVALAREGADLALLDVDEKNALETAEMVREAGRRAEFYRADVSERESIEKAVDDAWKAQGPIALACANAGVGTIAPLVEMEERDIDWVMGVNLFGVLNTVRAYVKHVQEAKSGGYLLLTGSENSVAVPHALRRFGLGVYGMTKHAVLSMGDTLRYELEPDGIGVSVLLPGSVRTEIQDSGRNRPERLGGRKEMPPVDPSMFDPSIRMPPSIDTDAAARIALDGLRAERFMIPTHSHILGYAQARLDALEDATKATTFEPNT